MIDSTANALLNGLDIEEILRKQLKKDPLEKILNPDPEDLAGAVAPSKDTASLSAESLEAARSLLAETTAPKDYAEELLASKRMSAQQALDALAAEVNVMDYMSEEMRDAVNEVKTKGALKKQEDVQRASEKNVNELKEEIERAAAAAMAPKDADGNPIGLPGDTSASEAAADIPTAQAAQAAPAVNLNPTAVVDGGAAPAAETGHRAAPKLNITV